MGTKRYKRDFKALETRRRRGMRMLARGVPQAEVARQCEVSRQTAMTWARMLAEDPRAWRRRALGRPGVFRAKDRVRLGKLLVQGAMANGFPTEVWTLSHVWTLLREMGFSSQRPMGRATQRDEQAILNWKTKRWPALKKTPDETDAPSSSSTNRG